MRDDDLKNFFYNRLISIFKTRKKKTLYNGFHKCFCETLFYLVLDDLLLPRGDFDTCSIYNTGRVLNYRKNSHRGLFFLLAFLKIYFQKELFGNLFFSFVTTFYQRF